MQSNNRQKGYPVGSNGGDSDPGDLGLHGGTQSDG